MKMHKSRGRFGRSHRKHQPKNRRTDQRKSLRIEPLETRQMLDGQGLTAPVEPSLDHSAWQDIDGAGTSGIVQIGVSLDEAKSEDIRIAFQEYEQYLAAGNAAEAFEITPLKLRLVNFDRFDQALHHGTFVGLYDNVIVGTWRSETLVGSDDRDLIVGMGGNDTFKGYGGDDILIGGSGKDSYEGGRRQRHGVVRRNGRGL